MPHLGEVSNQGSGAAAGLTLSGSPFTYSALRAGILLISAGTVSLVQYGRLGSLYAVGLLAGAVPIAKGDSVKITYIVAPTVTFVPL